jgi:hypothetical protein
MVTGSCTAKPLGVILHRGRSDFDGSPYVVIMPLGKPSKNGKTGKMLQTYIIRSHVHPVQAVRTGGDSAICGAGDTACPLQGVFVRKRGKRKFRACYVNVGQGPAMVYSAFRRGRYVDYSSIDHDQFIRGRKIRFGTYGEPVLIPLGLMHHLASISAGWTGYTHQWSKVQYAGYRQYLMASVHGLTGPWSREHAKHLGWRTFRTMRGGLPADSEILCPASLEAGKRLTCEQCRLCDGAGTRKAGLSLVDVYIPGHGGKAIMSAINHLPILQA